MNYLNEQRVLTILTGMRPAYSMADEWLCERYLDPMPGVNTDGYGNRYAVMGDTPPTTMFSSHTDTVHLESGQQDITFDSYTGDVFLPNGSRSNCLGADDGVGVALMIELYERGVPGLYVWHRAEEVGGQGSEYFAEADPAGVLGRIQRCIAFDRMGTDHIITHQMGSRCMSEAAARWLAGELIGTWPGGGAPRWQPNDGGLFTDSANYMHLIPECTNLSVGYWEQHHRTEHCNLYFLDSMLAALLDVEWSAMPVARVPDVDVGMGTGDVELRTWEDAYSFVLNNPEDAATLLLETFKLEDIA